MSSQSSGAMKDQRETPWAVLLQRDAAIDILKQWAHAASSRDHEELRNAINNRDDFLGSIQ